MSSFSVDDYRADDAVFDCIRGALVPYHTSSVEGLHLFGGLLSLRDQNGRPLIYILRILIELLTLLREIIFFFAQVLNFYRLKIRELLFLPLLRRKKTLLWLPRSQFTPLLGRG